MWTGKKYVRTIVLTLLCTLLLTLLQPAYASAETDLQAIATFDTYFVMVVNALESILFYPIFGFPALILWIVIGGFFFSFATGFVNVRLLGHAFMVTAGRYSKPSDPGEITHFQAMATSISGTVGLGNIAGVSVAVALGGPGAVVWMMVAGVFGMATKFAEATLGHKYRIIGKDGSVTAGAFHYLQNGLAETHSKKLGRFLALMFAVCCLGGAFGAGNMFQANQTVAVMTDTYDSLAGMGWIISIILAACVGVVLIGGISRIAQVAEKIVPLMAIIYITSCIVVIISNRDLVGDAMNLMFAQAFDMQALLGGSLGILITGFQRSAFSNEAGIGSASIVHPTARNTEPVRAGCTALLETFVDTMVICLLTGLVITITGVYADTSKTGIELASASFSTVIDWFPILLSICVFFFAFSTMITWSYYGEQAWMFLTKGRFIRIYQLLFCVLIFFGGSTDKVLMIVTFADILLMAMAIPNLIGMYLLSGVVRSEVKSYMARLKQGKITPAVAQPA